MPSTYTLISANTLSASTATVTFSAIPGTFTDLCLRVSARTDASRVDDSVAYRFNSATTNYSDTRLQSNGSTVTSAARAGTWNLLFYGATGNTATSNTFANGELYIPSYTVAQNKPQSVFGVNETNATTAFMAVGAVLWRDTAAITNILLAPDNGSNFVSGSSFYLYGIKST